MMKLALGSMVLAVSLAACGGGSSSVTDHRTNLAPGETAVLAAQLVPVPGYSYVDASEPEVTAAIENLGRMEQAIGVHDFFAGVSLHAVVTSKPVVQSGPGSAGVAEVGKLTFYEFRTPPPAGSKKEYASVAVSGQAIGRLDISGTSVLVLQNPSSPGRPYHYSWVRHGVQGTLDGADRPVAERWLRAYLAKPVLAEGETAKLSAWLTGVPGYAYGNFTSSSLANTWVRGPLGAVPFSLHQITDADGVFGTLVLMEVPARLSSQQLVAALRRHVPGLVSSGDSTELGGVVVEHLVSSSGLDAFAWAHNGIAGVFLTTHPEKATPFLTALLAAKR